MINLYPIFANKLNGHQNFLPMVPEQLDCSKGIKFKSYYMIDNMNLVMHNSLLLISRVLLMLFMFVDLEFILYIISSLIKNLFINLH